MSLAGVLNFGDPPGPRCLLPRGRRPGPEAPGRRPAAGRARQARDPARARRGNHATGVSPILEIQALGVLIINGQGVAADLDVDLSLHVTGLSVDASTRVLFNSTGLLQQVEIPGRLYDFLSDQADTNPLAQDLLDRLCRLHPAA